MGQWAKGIIQGDECGFLVYFLDLLRWEKMEKILDISRFIFVYIIDRELNALAAEFGAEISVLYGALKIERRLSHGHRLILAICDKR